MGQLLSSSSSSKPAISDHLGLPLVSNNGRRIATKHCSEYDLAVLMSSEHNLETAGAYSSIKSAYLILQTYGFYLSTDLILKGTELGSKLCENRQNHKLVTPGLQQPPPSHRMQ